MTYRDEATALDARILQFVRSASTRAYGTAQRNKACHPEETAAAVVSKGGPEPVEGPVNDDFNSLALDIFAHQLRYNEPYAKYCATFGVTLNSIPALWE